MRFLSPLQRHWDDVKGNAKWDLFKEAMKASPFFASLGTGILNAIREASWWQLIAGLFLVYVGAWLLAALISEIAWYLRKPSLEVTLENKNTVTYCKDMPSMGSRLFIRNPHNKTLKIALVRIGQMDTNSSHVNTGMAAFPIDLFRDSDGGPKLLHPGELWELDFLLEGKAVTYFGKEFIRARFPTTGHLQFVAGGDYRLHLCILIEDFPMHDERYFYRVRQNGFDYLTAHFSRIPRWKKAD
ncbi:MAG: hypothetical protein HYV96_10520 [Opitutae bacterium]|nr:hypothetical protein [Opitutae bacterium]